MRQNAAYSPALYLIFSQMYNPVIACQAPPEDSSRGDDVAASGLGEVVGDEAESQSADAPQQTDEDILFLLR